MAKRLTYEQRVRRKMPSASLAWRFFQVQVTAFLGGSLKNIGNRYTRPRDAWRSAWRNLKGRK